jgi:hypothetical protein
MRSDSRPLCRGGHRTGAKLRRVSAPRPPAHEAAATRLHTRRAMPARRIAGNRGDLHRARRPCPPSTVAELVLSTVRRGCSAVHGRHTFASRSNPRGPSAGRATEGDRCGIPGTPPRPGTWSARPAPSLPSPEPSAPLPLTRGRCPRQPNGAILRTVQLGLVRHAASCRLRCAISATSATQPRAVSGVRSRPPPLRTLAPAPPYGLGDLLHTSSRLSAVRPRPPPPPAPHAGSAARTSAASVVNTARKTRREHCGQVQRVHLLRDPQRGPRTVPRYEPRADSRHAPRANPRCACAARPTARASRGLVTRASHGLTR